MDCQLEEWQSEGLASYQEEWIVKWNASYKPKDGLLNRWIANCKPKDGLLNRWIASCEPKDGLLNRWIASANQRMVCWIYE